MAEKYVRAALALLPIIALIGIIFYLLIWGAPENAGETLMILIGALVALTKEGSGYYLGSSQGSADKTAAMINRDKNRPPDDGGR